MKVIVTGATGFIGVPLVRALRERGHHVVALVRDPSRAKAKLPTDVELVQAELEAPGPWTKALDGADAIAHLAGEPIAAKRWDARQKQLIRDSRVESTRTIVEAIGAAAAKPGVLVCASGVDYYPFAVGAGDFDDDEFTEDDKPSDSFLGRLCRDWENEALAAAAHGVRVVCMRTGLVLGHGGALEKLRKPFELFAGGKIGNGRQFMSWIHLDDAVAAYVAALTDERYRGPVNLVTASARNADFSRALARALGKPSWLPVPSFALKIVVGSELAESILNGRNVVPAKLRANGFAWKHASLDEALASALR
jgi:uncharacterized protein (TIGR01777 family)